MGKQSNCLRWMVFTASSFVTMFAFAFLFAFASLFQHLLDTYGKSRPETVTVQAILIGVTLSTGVLSGILTNRYGTWRVAAVGATLCPLGLILAFFATSIVHLYIYIGCITGLGISLLYVSSTTALSLSFNGSQRLLVLALNQSCVSVAAVVLAYLFNFLVHIYGIKGTFLLYGGLLLNGFVVIGIFAVSERENINGILKRPLDVTNVAFKDNAISKSDINCFGLLKQELMKLKGNVVNVLSTPYLLHLFGVGIIVSSLNAYFSLVLDILQWKGFSQASALVAFPVAYGAGFVARILPGLIKQCKGVTSLVLPIVFGLCGCIGLVISYTSSSHLLLLVGCGLSGIAVSGVVSAAGIVVVQIVGQDNMAIGFGLIQTAIGVLSAALGPAYGAIRDSSGSYDVVLVFTSEMQLVGTVLLIATAVTRKRMEDSNSSSDNAASIPRGESQIELVHSVSQQSIISANDWK